MQYTRRGCHPVVFIDLIDHTQKSQNAPHIFPDSKVNGADMGAIWDRQDRGRPHVGPINFAIWVAIARDHYGEYMYFGKNEVTESDIADHMFSNHCPLGDVNIVNAPAKLSSGECHTLCLCMICIEMNIYPFIHMHIMHIYAYMYACMY